MQSISHIQRSIRDSMRQSSTAYPENRIRTLKIDCEVGGIWGGKKEPNRSDSKCFTHVKSVTEAGKFPHRKGDGMNSGKPFAVIVAKVTAMLGHQQDQ